MGVLNLFSKAKTLKDLPGFAAFIESRSSFMVQKSTWEYCRARSGIVWEKLFREASFKQAIDRSTWGNLPLCLGHVCEMLEGQLRPHAGADRVALTEGMVEMLKAAVARFEQPKEFGPDYWPHAQAEVEARLRLVGLAATRAVKDIPIATAGEYMDRLPIHETLRFHDQELVRNNLRLFLCRIQDDFEKIADAPALAHAVVVVGRSALDARA
jgi:hypothetical protein